MSTEKDETKIADREFLHSKNVVVTGAGLAVLEPSTFSGTPNHHSRSAEFCILRGKMCGEDKYQREFEAEVTRKLRDGWRLHGAMTVLPSGVTGWFYVTQAMTKD